MRSNTVGEIHRRDFLKISAAGAVAASLPETLHALAADSPAGSISVWSTTATKKYEKQKPLSWGKATAGKSAITVNPKEQYQEVLGFGGAFTDSTCFTLNRLEPDVRKKLFHEFFAPGEMNLSAGRVCIGASDYSRNAYSYDDSPEPDPELKRFSIDHDREYILPILKEARAVNPNLWLLGSPWSPPGWMKFNNSMMGGSMRRKYLGAYSQYFEKFLDSYAEAGVRINSVTSQNEVDTDQDGRMPACIWPQEYEIEFVRDFLGPRMAKAANPADIWILDHNYNLWGRALGELEDPGTRKVVKGIAWHGYVGSADAMSHVKKAHPTVDMFWTEGGPDFEAPGYEVEWAKWGAQFTEILRNWARAVIVWNLALDEVGNPNIGPFKCAGLVTVHSKTREVVHSGQLHAMQHFARNIRRGAKIIQSSGDLQGVAHVAAHNRDGSYSIVLTNTTKEARTVNLTVGASGASVELPADSITTLSWS
jgi:glucosylceramidase